MTRVSSFSQSQALLQGLLENQQRIFEAQRQVTTGKISDEFKGIASETSTLVSAKALKARTDGYVRAANEVNLQVNSYDLQIGAIVDAARNFKQGILESIGQEQAIGFDGQVSDVFNLVKNALNFNANGVYIFSGSRTDTAAVTLDDVTDLAALGDATEAFNNDQVKSQARLSDSFEVSHGQLADDIAGDIFSSLKRIVEFNAGPDGPIDGPLTASQRAFLETELGALETAIQQVQNAQVLNGLNANKIEDIQTIQQQQSDYLEIFIADVEDVDIAEAITRLNNDRTALEASYRVVGSISQLSLVGFI